jgi:hypothetical protein
MVIDYGAGEASGLVLSTTQIPINFNALSPETRASCTVPAAIWYESPGFRRPARQLFQRLIPSKLAAMPRWNSDQSKPSANAR